MTSPAMSEAIERPATLSERTVATARGALAGRHDGLRTALAFAGPAVIASIAYMDPGNFATNIQAGARYGYGLLWVVLLANVIAMLFQGLSAKLGIVTGRNLAELCRDHFPRPVVWPMWVVSEIAAMATDLAEFLGGAIGLSLLLHLPLLAGMVVTAIVTYGLLMSRSSASDRSKSSSVRSSASSVFATSWRCSSCRWIGRRRFFIPSRRSMPMPRRCCWRSASSAPP
jgi:manganese transport protein